MKIVGILWLREIFFVAVKKRRRWEKPRATNGISGSTLP